MPLSQFQQIVRSTEELESLIGLPSELVIRKQLAELDQHMQAFIARSPFMLLGTSGADGSCDVSPRGELPSVATVLDRRTLVIPDRPGNRRVDSLRNIIQTGRVGILFLVPGVSESLRVNGRACILRDLMGMKNILALNDEAHHCYREKPPEPDDEVLKGDEKKEAEKNREAARLWISGPESVNRQLGLRDKHAQDIGIVSSAESCTHKLHSLSAFARPQHSAD